MALQDHSLPSTWETSGDFSGGSGASSQEWGSLGHGATRGWEWLYVIHYRDPFLQRFRLSLGVTSVTFMHPNATQLHSPEVGIPHWGSKWHWGSIPVGAHFDTQHGLTQLRIEV